MGCGVSYPDGEARHGRAVNALSVMRVPYRSGAVRSANTASR